MSDFEEKLNSATISEKANCKILFESFVLKKYENYDFVYITHDLEAITPHRFISNFESYRYMTKSKSIVEIKKFLGIPIFKKIGYLHTIVSLVSEETKNFLKLNVYGYDEFENLKKISQTFISKYPDINVELELETASSEYAYDEVEKFNFWQIFKEIFIRTNILNE